MIYKTLSKFIILLIALLGLQLSGYCDTIKIGVVVPLAGDMASDYPAVWRVVRNGHLELFGVSKPD